MHTAHGSLSRAAAALLVAAIAPLAHADHPADEAFYGIEIHEWLIAMGGAVPSDGAHFHANPAGRKIIGGGELGPVTLTRDTVTFQLIVEGHLHDHVEEGAYFDIGFDLFAGFASGSLTLVSAAMEATGESHDLLNHTLFSQGVAGPFSMSDRGANRVDFQTSPFSGEHGGDAAPHDGDVLGDFIFTATFEWTGAQPTDALSVSIPDGAFRIAYVPSPGLAAAAAPLMLAALRRRR